MVGKDFCYVLSQFFDSFFLPPGVNTTASTLILKCAGMERLSNIGLFLVAM